jgi:hypothetical protein
VIAATPHVVLTVPARIHALRTGGTTIGWLEGQCETVKVLLHGRVVTLGKLSCDNEYSPLLAIAQNGEGVWVASYSGNDIYFDVTSRHYYEQVEGQAAVPAGEYVTGVAAAAGRVFFSILGESSSDGCIGGEGTCTSWAGGAVKLITGKRATRIAALPPAAALAGGDDRLAILVQPHDLAVHPSAIDVFAVPGYRRVATVPVTDKVLALAVSHAAVAVLTPGVVHVGSRTIPVGQDVTRIALRGTHVAYTSGKAVYVDGRVVVRRSVPPIGASFAGTRLVWAERSRGRSVIYSLP